MTFDREPDVPLLTPAESEVITETTFMPHDPTSAEVLFMFGTIQGDWDGLAASLLAGTYPRVICTGHEAGQESALADRMKEHFMIRGIEEGRIATQDRSSNTTEDVSLSLDLIGDAEVIAFGAKSHHSGRCQRVLRRFFPDATLKAYTFDALYGGVPCSRDNWWQDKHTRARVYGEYLRIQDYALRGWISATP